MTDDEHLAQLNLTAEEIAAITEAAFKRVLDNLGLGMDPRTAVATEMTAILAKWNGDFLGILGKALEERIGRSVGTAELKAYPVGGLALSRRLYHNSKEVSAVVLNILHQERQGWHSARDLALKIYEGYGFKEPAPEPLDVKAQLPKYLRAAFGDDAAFAALWKAMPSFKTLKALAEDTATGPALAKLYARIKAGALKTPYLKAAYLEALDALEKGKGQTRLAKKLQVAFYERNRYFANRIAQTEIHRAQSGQRARELMGEPRVHWVQVRLSSRHPRVDICDLRAKLDQYGLGPGVYPKGQCPKPPFHPFCLCLLRPRVDLEPGVGDFTGRPDAERAYLERIPAWQARQIAGSKEKLQRVRDGESLEAILNAGKDPLYHVARVGDASPMSSPVVSLPNHDRAEIDRRKLLEYALNPDHEFGRNKARRFKAALGYDKENADGLMDAIRRELGSHEAVDSGENSYGRMFTVDIPLTGPSGSAVVRTGWIIRKGEENPRLTTLYVKES